MAKRLDMRRGSTTVLVLSLLTERPMYGYQISKELSTRSDGVFDFKEGTLYPALHRMEKDGLLSSYWEVVEEGPSRKYYTITDRGRDALSARSRAISPTIVANATAVPVRWSIGPRYSAGTLRS